MNVTKHDTIYYTDSELNGLKSKLFINSCEEERVSDQPLEGT